MDRERAFDPLILGGIDSEYFVTATGRLALERERREREKTTPKHNL